MLDDGYGIMPNKILFDDNLSPSAKLLYCYISSLCSEKGYCWAKNKTIAAKFNLSVSQVSKLLSDLSAYLVMKDGENHHRKVFLREPTQKPEGSLRKNQKANNNSISSNINSLSSSQNSQDVRKVYELYLKQFIIPMRLKDRIDNTPQKKLMALAEARYKLSPGKRDAIKHRLKDAGVKMLCAAIIGYSREPWYLGENTTGWYAKLDEFICRSYDKVEEGANKYAAQKQSKNANDPWNS